MFLRNLVQILVVINYQIVFIQHWIVHLALIHTRIVVRVVLLTLQTSGQVTQAHAL